MILPSKDLSRVLRKIKMHRQNISSNNPNNSSQRTRTTSTVPGDRSNETNKGIILLKHFVLRYTDVIVTEKITIKRLKMYSFVVSGLFPFEEKRVAIRGSTTDETEKSTPLVPADMQSTRRQRQRTRKIQLAVFVDQAEGPNVYYIKLPRHF